MPGALVTFDQVVFSEISSSTFHFELLGKIIADLLILDNESKSAVRAVINQALDTA